MIVVAYFLLFFRVEQNICERIIYKQNLELWQLKTLAYHVLLERLNYLIFIYKRSLDCVGLTYREICCWPMHCNLEIVQTTYPTHLNTIEAIWGPSKSSMPDILLGVFTNCKCPCFFLIYTNQESFLLELHLFLYVTPRYHFYVCLSTFIARYANPYHY